MNQGEKDRATSKDELFIGGGGARNHRTSKAPEDEDIAWGVESVIPDDITFAAI